MIQPRGNPQDGPFITNSNSPCGDDTYTPMESGDDGGLATGAYQPNPEPAFDGAGNAQARGIFKPLNFQGIAYGGSTNEVDPQTGKDVAAPSFAVTSTGKLTGNVESVSVAWNNQHFNQGAPKPDGSTPGLTQTPHGTLDTATNAFEFEWTSTISGGPFDGFTGLWHLEGTFAPNARPSAPASSGSSEVSAQSNDGSTSEVAAAGASGGSDSGSSLGSSSAKAKSLPNTGPAVPSWLVWLFIVNGFVFGLAWIKARRPAWRAR
jgi:hypothetical protein